MMEGITDVQYIRRALELKGRSDLLDGLEITAAGVATPAGQKGGGSSHMDKVATLLRQNPGLSNRRIFLLYDRDCNKGDKDEGAVHVRTMPALADDACDGIEAFLPAELREDRHFWTVKKSLNNRKLEKTTREELDKRKLCDHVCSVSECEGHFDALDPVIKLLEDFCSARG